MQALGNDGEGMELGRMSQESKADLDFMDEPPASVQSEIRLAYKESFDESELLSKEEVMSEIQQFRKAGGN